MIWLLWACTGELDEPVTSLPNEDPLEPAVVPDGGEPLEEIAASHILVKYEGASGSVGITRSRGQALEMIEEARARIVAGEDFRVVAWEVSNDRSSVRGGWIGVGDYSTWVPEFSDVAFALEVGELSAVVETPFGFHIIRREPRDPVALKHIVIRHGGSPGSSDAEVSARTRGDARALANQARERVHGGEDFEEVAKDLSDGTYGPRGGDLGEFLGGQLGVEFDEAVDELEPGELSEVFETRHGYHVILRYE